MLLWRCFSGLGACQETGVPGREAQSLGRHPRPRREQCQECRSLPGKGEETAAQGQSPHYSPGLTGPGLPLVLRTRRQGRIPASDRCLGGRVCGDSGEDTGAGPQHPATASALTFPLSESLPLGFTALSGSVAVPLWGSPALMWRGAGLSH